MHWLQALDSALFHFINRSLSNSFCDWLMPILSGRGVPWPAAVVLLAAGFLAFGSPRARMCALLMVLVVALGDPLVLNTIKHAVALRGPASRCRTPSRGLAAPLPAACRRRTRATGLR